MAPSPSFLQKPGRKKPASDESDDDSSSDSDSALAIQHGGRFRKSYEQQPRGTVDGSRNLASITLGCIKRSKKHVIIYKHGWPDFKKTIKIPSILSGFFWGNLVRKSEVKTQPRLSGRQEETSEISTSRTAEVMTVRRASRNLHSLHVRGPRDFSGDQLFIPTEIEDDFMEKKRPSWRCISYWKTMVIFQPSCFFFFPFFGL